MKKFLLVPVLGLGALVAAFTFDGAPTSPTVYNPPEFDVTYTLVGDHDEPQQWDSLINEDPQHGPNCEPPGHDGSVTHIADMPSEVVFHCANHIMTYGPSATSGVRLSPNQLLDLSSGVASFTFDVSTETHSSRDWIGVFVQNYDVAESKIINSDTPSNQGNPRDAIEFEQGGGDFFDSTSGKWHIRGYNGNRDENVIVGDFGDPSIYDYVTPSAQTRIKFKATIAQNGYVKLELPDIIDQNTQLPVLLNEGFVDPFTWDHGVVTFLHNTYSPDKSGNPRIPFEDCPNFDCGEPNTWHWDNIELTPNIPQTIIKTDHRYGGAIDTFVFDQPLPANTTVRFEGFGGDAFVSFDGGPEVQASLMSLHTHFEHAASFAVPGLQGATTITIRMTDEWAGESIANVRGFSKSGGSTPPPPPPPPPSDVCNIAYYRNGILTMGAVVPCP